MKRHISGIRRLARLVPLLLALLALAGCAFAHKGRIIVSADAGAGMASMEMQVADIVGQVAQRHGLAPSGGFAKYEGQPRTMERGWVWKPAGSLRSEPTLGICRTGDGGLSVQIEMRSDSPDPGITGQQIIAITREIDTALRARFGDGRVSSSLAGFGSGTTVRP